MRVLVTGSRDWPYPEVVYRELNNLLTHMGRCETLTVVHGDCPRGADQFARRWAGEQSDLNVQPEPHPADWKYSGKAAGMLRNKKMVDLGADLCLAFNFNSSRGTADCVYRAREAGIPCRIIRLSVEEVK